MAPPDRAITLVHSSDIHIDGRASESFHPLCKVVDTAVRLHADVLLLAGDVFDHNRLPLEQIGRAGISGDHLRVGSARIQASNQLGLASYCPDEFNSG